MNEVIRSFLSRSLFAVTVSVVCLSLLWGQQHVAGQAGPVRMPLVTALPSDLFIAAPPSDAVDVKVARSTAQEGKPISLKGRIGGTSAPIAENRAIFLVADLQLPLCQPGCASSTPWDACSLPREMVVANVATVQVPDKGGQPLRTNLKGFNGLNPMAEVVIVGTVARKDVNNLLVNARHIYVKR